MAKTKNSNKDAMDAILANIEKQMGNKGKPKSDEHKRNIAKNRKGGRPLADPTETMNLYLNHGINKSAEILGIPISTFRSRVITAKRNTGNQL